MSQLILNNFFEKSLKSVDTQKSDQSFRLSENIKGQLVSGDE